MQSEKIMRNIRKLITTLLLTTLMLSLLTILPVQATAVVFVNEHHPTP